MALNWKGPPEFEPSDDPVKLKLGVLVVENLNTVSGLLLFPPKEKPVFAVCALPKLKAMSGFFGAGAPSPLVEDDAAASEPKPLENAEEEPNVGIAAGFVLLLLVGTAAGADAVAVGAPNPSKPIDEPNTGPEVVEPNIPLDPVAATPPAETVLFEEPKIVDVAEGAPNDGIAEGAAPAVIGFTSPT